MANATGLFKASNGLRANYDLLASKDANTMYVCHGDQNYKHGIYVGGERVAVDGKLENLTGANTGQVVINIDGDTATVYNTTAINQMISSIMSGITWKGDISVANLKLVTGYKVGWLYRINSTTGNPWTTNVDLEIGDYILCINDYNSAFAATDFVVWERNLTGAITCVNGINGWTNGVTLLTSYTPGSTVAQELPDPTVNTGADFLKFIASGQAPIWTPAVEPYHYYYNNAYNKLTNHAIIVGRGDNQVVAIGTGTAGNILYSGGANADPVWLANSSTDGYVLKWSNSAGHPVWAAESGGGGSQGDGNTEYDLVVNGQAQSKAGYVNIDSFDAANGGAQIASGAFNIFRNFNPPSPNPQEWVDEGIIIYAPNKAQQFTIGNNSAFDTNASTAYGETMKINLPTTSGLLYLTARNGNTAPSLGYRSITSNVTQGSNDVITSGGVYNALAWGTF